MGFFDPPDKSGPGDGMPDNNRVDLPPGSMPNVDIRVVQFIDRDGQTRLYRGVEAANVPYSQIAGLLLQAAIEIAIGNMTQGTGEQDGS